MALRPKYTRPGSTMLSRLRIVPERISAKDRSVLAATAAYSANLSTNAANAAEISIPDINFVGIYQPSTAPTQSSSITTHTIGAWTIDSACPDFQPGDSLIFQTQTNRNNGTDTDDALLAAGLVPMGVTIAAGVVTMYLYNSTGGGVATPASYNPQFLLIRTTTSDKVD